MPNLEKCKIFLTQLRDSKADVVWQTSTPQTFARRIYQALDTAYRTNHELGKLHGKFRLRQKGDRVIAERIEVIATLVENTVYKTKTIVEPVTLAEIIGIILEEQLDEAVFEIPALDVDSYAILNKWCKSFNYEYTTNPLTIKRQNGRKSDTEGDSIRQEISAMVRGDPRGLFELDSESTVAELSGSDDEDP